MKKWFDLNKALEIGRSGTCSRVAECEFNWRARAALEAREWAWRWGRRWEMSCGGSLSRRSWIERLREEAFWSNSRTYFCWSGVNTIGIELGSPSSLPCPPPPPPPPTTSAAHASNPAMSLSLPLSTFSLPTPKNNQTVQSRKWTGKELEPVRIHLQIGLTN